MHPQHPPIRCATTVVALALLATHGLAQTSTVFASGLDSPTKIVLTTDRELLVAEGGTAANTGRITRLDRQGVATALLGGLPSGLEAAGQPQGPSGIEQLGRTLLVAFGGADVTVSGATPGTEAPNPMGPSSPLVSSVVEVRFSRPIRLLASGFTLSLADHFTIAHGGDLELVNAEGARARFRLHSDFRDLVRDPAINVRRSNPFGIDVDLLRGVAWVVDSSQNSLERVDLRTGRIKRVLDFSPLPNPLPFGPPLLEAVPTSVRRFGGRLLVSLESGFPFPSGGTSVQIVDPVAGTEAPFISGLTNALDVLPVGFGSGADFLVVELSTDILMGAPGRLLLFDTPTSAPQVLDDQLNGPTSVAFDRHAGEAFVTEVFTGNVIRVSVP